MPNFFHKLSPNLVRFLNFEMMYTPDPIKFNKICYSPDPVQSKSSPMLTSGARSKKQVLRPYARTWGLSEANVL